MQSGIVESGVMTSVESSCVSRVVHVTLCSPYRRIVRVTREHPRVPRGVPRLSTPGCSAFLSACLSLAAALSHSLTKDAFLI